MGETGNYQLKQWEKTDRIQMEDFNADNAKIEAALAALQTEKADQADLPWVKIGEATLTESAQQVSVNVPDVEQYISLFLVFEGSGSSEMGLMWTGMDTYSTIANQGRDNTMTRCCGFILAVPMPAGGVFARRCYYYTVTSSGSGDYIQLLSSAATNGNITVSFTGKDSSTGKEPLAAGSQLIVYGIKK